MNGYGPKRLAAKRRRRRRFMGRRALLWGDIEAAQRREADRVGEHACMFRTAQPQARCGICGETMESQFGKGSSLLDIVAAQQAGHEWGPYDAQRDPRGQG